MWHGCQGVSCAGKQLGRSDSRTALLSEVFRIYDALPHPQKSGPYMNGGLRVLRFFLFLENVQSILGKKHSMRDIMNYIVQDLELWRRLGFCGCQECGRRGLKLFWASLSLYEVGLAAP